MTFLEYTNGPRFRQHQAPEGYQIAEIYINEYKISVKEAFSLIKQGKFNLSIYFIDGVSRRKEIINTEANISVLYSEHINLFNLPHNQQLLVDENGEFTFSHNEDYSGAIYEKIKGNVCFRANDFTLMTHVLFAIKI